MTATDRLVCLMFMLGRIRLSDLDQIHNESESEVSPTRPLM